MKLDLGSGPNPPEGYLGVDRRLDIASDRVMLFDLISGERWPWEDNSIDALRSCHMIEHIPADEVAVGPGRLLTDRLVFFFNEAWRVAKPGALFDLIWPPLQSSRAFQDPTHRRFIPSELLDYFNRETRDNGGLHHIGAECDWVIEGEGVQGFRLQPDQGGPPVERDFTLEGLREKWNQLSDYRALLRARK